MKSPQVRSGKNKAGSIHHPGSSPNHKKRPDKEQMKLDTTYLKAEMTTRNEMITHHNTIKSKRKYVPSVGGGGGSFTRRRW